ncbi:apolipoprotein N-acyltransferase [Chitinophaga nivalis]|uniref:Apolipoprotein N-acyltransferase n=1 Tax=Chitinophaga nivalis TaxID=2991709 RepID=A0ABT3ISP0_9BACT|nr:apolipoprotein N-acyltransferase [Chitinophaga nivalis]MCW3463322.1 apolipoprotein N-acyltransferase [Chitinophaga nivalis]MCW3486988.1 apolipoprotein N-acyltransferase [Chitinophaga nivalis]
MKFVLSILTGVLLWLAWPTLPLTPLIFIGLTPLFYLTERVQNRWQYFGLIFLAFLTWNVGSTWWVGNTTVPASGVFANCFNALLMSIPWLGYKNTRRKLPESAAYFALIVYWLTFELIHQTWELSWPWLVLGNAFALRPGWIQWYEFTGASGGTLWVLTANIAVYHTWKQLRLHGAAGITHIVKSLLAPLAVILLPLLLSAFIHPIPDNPARKTGIVIVQPNIDPYDEKFNSGTAMQQLEKFLRLTQQQADSNTRYIIWPETALFPRGAWESQLNYQQEVIAIREMLRKYPKARLITGGVTMKEYPAGEAPATARDLEGDRKWDAFNSALQIDTSNSIQIYHKYELVPGVELIPYVRYLTFMQYVAMDMGGISGSYGRTPDATLLTNTSDSIKVFPTICYESVFSNYVGAQVKTGADLLVIITNDGWWGNTEGHRQHLQYARIRAIETRRWVARSANTGISAVVDPAGNISHPQPYWQEAVIKATVTPRKDITFYVKNGDLISKGAVIFCILLLVYSFMSRFIPGLKHAEIHQ